MKNSLPWSIQIVHKYKETIQNSTSKSPAKLVKMPVLLSHYVLIPDSETETINIPNSNFQKLNFS